MAALRAMLQLRPGASSPPSLSNSPSNSLSQTHTSPLQSAVDTPSLSSTATLTSSLPTTNATAVAAAVASVQHTSGNAVTTAAASTPTRPVSNTHNSKKPLNLGLHSGAASGNLGKSEYAVVFHLVPCLVKFALDNGQPIDSVVNGVLPIHAACCSNANVAVVLFLIERGADVNARRYPRKYSGERVVGAQTVGTTGSTPLHFAAANGCLTIVEILLRHGAIADLADKYGSTPCSVATARNHPDVASLLHEHASMQRGLQIITPEIDPSRDRDPFTSPRASGDFSRRVSAIMAPTRVCTQQAQKQHTEGSPVALPALSTAVGRQTNQRRVSLPCIMESPTAPTAPSAPRQSCDMSRTLFSRETLPARAESADARLLTIVQTTPGGSSLSLQNPTVAANEIEQRAPASQGFLPSLLNTLDPTPIAGRRRSIDATGSGYLSPPPHVTTTAPQAILRRVSLDFIRAMRPADGKPRRDSDASTSETVVSDPSSCSTLASPMMGDNDSRTMLEEATSEKSQGVKMHLETSPMGRSISQPPLSPGSAALRRIAERRARQSFDLRLFAAPRERLSAEAKEEDNGFQDPMDSSYRRRSMQETFGVRDFEEDDRGFFTRSMGGVLSSASVGSFQELSPRDHFRSHNYSSKHRASFSGSATISGRLSRFWSYGSAKELLVHNEEGSRRLHDKNGSAGSMGSMGEEDEMDQWSPSAGATGGDSKSRPGMMNRLSGMWTRR
ncbi:hypothetical protein EDD11_005458 [Mortierella claussenii]|nr:hypothetical protein EDD11_005458 [Mortierella claussenii]